MNESTSIYDIVAQLRHAYVSVGLIIYYYYY